MPIVGLSVVLTAAASANLKTFFGRLKAFGPPANQLTSHAPQIASSVLPVATPKEVKMFPSVVRFTRNAPTKIAGHMR